MNYKPYIDCLKEMKLKVESGNVDFLCCLSFIEDLNYLNQEYLIRDLIRYLKEGNSTLESINKMLGEDNGE